MTKKQMMPTQSSQSTNQSNALHTLKSSFGLAKAAKIISYPVLALGAVASANAGIIVVDGDINLNATTVPEGTSASVDWDIDGDSITDMSFGNGFSACGDNTSICLTSSGVGAGFASVGATSVDGSFVSNSLISVSSGTTVDSSNSFSHLTCADFFDVDCDHTSNVNDCSGMGFDLFDEADNFGGIFGFQFDNGGTTNYGVARFEVTSWDGDGDNGLGNFRITQWAYNDDGGAISGSALPDVEVSEPATIGIMLLGIGAMGLRRRRQAMKLAS
jgi:hypothetical protein